MCGIAGILSKEKSSIDNLLKMSTIMRHRGPDDEGFCLADNNYESIRGNDTIPELSNLKCISEIGNEFHVGFLHRRLSIIDLSKDGHQPRISNDGNYLIIFNGEIYNYKEIRQELIGHGLVFKSESDTEVILNSFIYWGEKCVEKFVGMWAFTIYNKVSEELFISRDRYGIKPFYYYHDSTHFAFASEIKALLELPFVDTIADVKSVGEFLTYGSISQPYSNLYKNIKELKPGTNGSYSFATNKLNFTSYYDLKSRIGEISIPSNFKLAAQKYDELFTQSLNLHLRSDVPVGTCLSGGLDSSAIVGSIMPELKGNRFKTFTAAFENPKIDESNYAKMVVNHFQNIEAHFTFPSAKGFLQEVDKIVYHHDQPIVSSSWFSHWEVMKLAGENGMKVLLNGQGADESLGGYSNFAGVYLLEQLKKFNLLGLIRNKHLLQENFTHDINSAIARATYYHLPKKLQTFFRKEERIGSQFLSKEMNNVLNLDNPGRGGKNFKENSILAFQFGLYELLRNEDRNSMAFSIESRVPFLDHRLVEYSIALPSSFKINEGWSKYILRKNMEHKLPKEVVWRKYKMGFLTPQREWKQELNKELIKEIKEMSFPDILDKNAFLRFCETDLKSNAHLSEFWRMYSLLKWINVFNVKF